MRTPNGKLETTQLERGTHEGRDHRLRGRGRRQKALPGYIPQPDRIATFDNDGTLWVEQPAPAQTGLLLGKLTEEVKADPSLALEEPFKAIVTGTRSSCVLGPPGAGRRPRLPQGRGQGLGGRDAGGVRGRGPSVPRDQSASTLRRPWTDFVYQPMLELIHHLRANGWRVYICSGGGRDFMRVFSEETCGICRENVIGSAPEFAYKDGRLVRQNEMFGTSPWAGKLEQIYARTGRMARFAAGNGDVDLEMLEEPTSGSLSCTTTPAGVRLHCRAGAVPGGRRSWRLDQGQQNDGWNTVFMSRTRWAQPAQREERRA